MSFIISADTASGQVRYRRASMLDALERGLALASCGMTDVAITDLDGRRHTPAEFSRRLFGARRDANSEASATGVGLAA